MLYIVNSFYNERGAIPMVTEKSRNDLLTLFLAAVLIGGIALFNTVFAAPVF